MLLDIFNLTLPLENPVLKFSLILFIILFAPLLLNRFKIPHLIGLIIAGAVIGPNGLGLILRDSSIVLFGTVGLLYIMFVAGLEIDLADFKKNKWKSLIFGMYTFLIPMVIGFIAGVYLLHFSVQSSILLASLFASHTLVTYPIVGRFGVTKNRAVNITVGGTMITDTLALLVLAVIVGMATGDLTHGFWLQLGISVIIFGFMVLVGFPIVARWFFKHFDDNISQYIFVLAMVFLAAFLAEAAGVESIIGAFLAGLALNRLITHTSPLMNRIEFVGNALFIPFFLIGVGMLVDIQAFIKDWDTIFVAVVMTVVALLAKYLAAYFTQKSLRFTTDERGMIFGLSNSQAAATLAAVLVGYNIVIGTNAAGETVRLLNETVLNGSILMILVTCTISSFVTQKAAKNIALKEKLEESEEDQHKTGNDKVLIPLGNPETVEELINLGAILLPAKSQNSLYALNVITSDTEEKASEKSAKKILEAATKTAAAADNVLHPIIRHDINLVNAISNVVKEQKITDIILGLHRGKTGIINSFLGSLTEGILKKCSATTYIYKSKQPLNTIKRQIVVVPPYAELEPGFLSWINRLWKIAINTKTKLVFFGSNQTIELIKEFKAGASIEADFRELSNWEDFLIVSGELRPNDGLIIVLSRKDAPSFTPVMNKIPDYLHKYFKNVNFILIYPVQYQDNRTSAVNHPFPPMRQPIEKLDGVGKAVAKFFKRK